MAPAKKKRPVLTHLNRRGEAHMVDVGEKPPTVRVAVAEAWVSLSAKAKAALRQNKKGDVLAVARIAGIGAAKKTSELIPLCHPLLLTHVRVDLTPAKKGLHIRAEVQTHGPTGVEMEALTAVSVAALAVYDMLKAVDRSIRLGPIQLLHKAGGKSGVYER